MKCSLKVSKAKERRSRSDKAQNRQKVCTIMAMVVVTLGSGISKGVLISRGDWEISQDEISGGWVGNLQ